MGALCARPTMLLLLRSKLQVKPTQPIPHGRGVRCVNRWPGQPRRATPRRYDRRAWCAHSFFWYRIYGRTESHSMCSRIICAMTCTDGDHHYSTNPNRGTCHGESVEWNGGVRPGDYNSRPVGTWWDVSVASSWHVVGHCCRAALSRCKGTHRLTNKGT